MRLLGRIIVNLLSVGFLFAILGAIAVAGAFWYFGRDLPDEQKLAAYEPPIVSRVYANDGRLIGEFASEKRVFVPIDRVPKRVVHAFIAAEDQRFFSHSGVDPFGLVRAVYQNALAMGTGRRLVGGSTITQQVAKNFLLTSEKTFERKIKEMILSMRIERAFSKDRILELYLNEIFLGGTAYGVAAAANVYFGKSLDELTIEEAAFLAGLPQAPSRYNPQRQPRVALNRRNYVIGRMAEDGYITKDEAEAAKAKPLKTLPPRANVSIGAEYFVEEVRREMLAKYGQEKMVKGGYVVRSTLDPRLQKFSDQALRRGLVAYDRRHGWRGAVKNLRQGQGERWADNWRRKLRAVEPPPGHGDWPLALVLNVEDNEVQIGFADGKRGRIPLSELLWARKQGEITVEAGKPTFKTATGPAIRKAGDVLDMGDVILVEAVEKDGQGKAYPPGTYALRQVPEVNGALVALDPHSGRILAMSGGYSFWLSQYNTATQAWRQPGSSFKSFVYAAALLEGCTPSTIILDMPIVVRIGNTVYRPRNSTGKFYGPTPLRTGIVASRNLMTVRLAERIGLEKVVEFVKKLNISDKVQPEMSLALGSYETTPLRMAAGYAAFVNGGKKIVPTLLERIQDRHGKTVARNDSRDCAKCTADAAGNMPALADNREQVMDPYTAYQMTSMMEDVVKYGTGVVVSSVKKTLGGKTGTTNDVLDAWFVGFSPDLVVAVWVGFDKPRTLGPSEQGGVTAAPIFRDFMRDALDGVDTPPFRKPPGLVSSSGEVFRPGTEPGKGNGCGDVTGSSASDDPDKPERRGPGSATDTY